MLHPYYEELLECLNARGARYLVAGAYAVAFHARPRFTKDLDLFVDAEPANAARVLLAVRDFFGGADPGLTLQDLTEPASIVQLGVAPVRIDLLKELTGIADFDAAWRRCVCAPFGRVTTRYLSLHDLMAPTAGAGRPLDKADLRSLAAALRRQTAPRDARSVKSHARRRGNDHG